MKTLIAITYFILILLGLQQIDVYLYNRQFDVNVLVAQYEVDLVELRNYRHWKPNITDVTGAKSHNMFEATPIRSEFNER